MGYFGLGLAWRVRGLNYECWELRVAWILQKLNFITFRNHTILRREEKIYYSIFSERIIRSKEMRSYFKAKRIVCSSREILKLRLCTAVYYRPPSLFISISFTFDFPLKTILSFCIITKALFYSLPCLHHMLLSKRISFYYMWTVNNSPLANINHFYTD